MAALPQTLRKIALGCGFTAAAALIWAMAPADGRASAWEFREQGGMDETPPMMSADAFAHSGNARMSIGCTPAGLLYASLDYIGYETASSALRVAYRVDGWNEITTRWIVEPRDSELLLYSTSTVYLQELSRRAINGSWLTLTVELLPPLRFSLSGSDNPITRVLEQCGNRGGFEDLPEEALAEAEAMDEAPGRRDERLDRRGERARPAGAPTPLVPNR